MWFRKAAEQNHPAAKLYLGVLYAEARGVSRDDVQAHMWFSLAAAQGQQKALMLLRILEQRMTPIQIVEAQKLARGWKPTTVPTAR